MKKSIKRILTICLAAIMTAMLTVGTMSFAATPTSEGTVTVSKKLAIAQGLAADRNFSFKITPKTVAGDDYVEGAAKGKQGYMPTFSNVTASTSTMKDTDADGYIIKNTSAINFAVQATSDDPLAPYGHAGIFVYEISEVVPSPSADEGNETTTYDTTVYTVNVYVKADGSVIVTVSKPATGEETEATKVNPNPETDTTDDGDDELSGVAFNNSYTKTADPDTDNNNASATVTKAVTGDYADTTKEFKFTTTVTRPAQNPTQAMTYVVYNADDSAATNATVLSTTTNTDGNVDTVTYTLKDGQYLAIKNAPVGTTYTTVETLDDAAADKYTASTVTTTGGVAAASVTGTQGDDTTVTARIEEKSTTLTETDKNKNSVAYTNKYTESTTPTGVIINNLPYIILAVVAVGGIAAYVIIKKRHQAEEA